MNTNDVFAADSDSLTIDIACYEKMFSDFVREFAKGKPILPEITTPILEANEAGPGQSIFKGLLYAFVGGVEAGIRLVTDMQDSENSNQTNIE